MSKGTLDALFWRLHTSYLLNDRVGSDKYLSMLMDEQINSKSTLRYEIGEENYKRYLRIKANIENGSFIRLYGTGFSVPSESYETCEVDKEEREFHLDLMHSPAALFSLIDVPMDAIMVHELELSDYGRCDFVLRHGRTVTAVEVKMGDSPTSVVSQIDKYRLGLELDMCLGLYDRVRAFVLAGSFGPYVASELSRVDVGMIVHHGTPEELRLVNASSQTVLA
jgi:hypothetical protein